MCFFPLLQVIYALNTKNDEHEAAIATLKEAHEEEVQQILSETREKILQVCVCICLTLYLLGSLPQKLCCLTPVFQFDRLKSVKFSFCVHFKDR